MSLLADHNLPFAAALALMALVAMVQALGLGGFGLDADTDPDPEVHGGSGVDVERGFAGLFGLGRVPFMIWLASFLLLFALLGFGIQALAQWFAGPPLDRLLAAVLAAGSALPATGILVRPLARILPGDTSTAVGLDALVGRRGTITTGRAAAGSPARAQVRDRHGHAHHVMVEPHDATGVIAEGEAVLLVRREQELFYAVPLEDRRLATS